MAGSGIEQALTLVYAPNTSNSLWSEKANARAIRGHFRLDSALFYTLISELNKHRDLQHSFEIIMVDSTQIDDISYDTTQSVVSELKDKQKASTTARHWFHLWFNLSSDLVIEQVMMRPSKGRGGLTRGTGFSKRTRLPWVESNSSRIQRYSWDNDINYITFDTIWTTYRNGHSTTKNIKQTNKNFHQGFKIVMNSQFRWVRWVIESTFHLVSSQMNQLLLIVIEPSQMARKSGKTLKESNWTSPRLNQKVESLLLIQ